MISRSSGTHRWEIICDFLIKTTKFKLWSIEANIAELEELEKKIKGKVNFLKFLSKETEEILSNNEPKDIDRHHKVYKFYKLDEIKNMKVSIQELKLESGENPADVRKWRAELEVNIRKFDPFISRLNAILDEFKQREEQKKEEKENQAKNVIMKWKLSWKNLDKNKD